MTNIDTPEPRSATPTKLPPLRPSPKVDLDISEDIIRRAIRGDSTACMIADAVKEQVPGAKYVAVDLQSVRWTDPVKGLRYVYLTPSNAQGALVMFDQGIEMEPFKVKLRGAQVTRSKALLPDVPRLGKQSSSKSPEVIEARKLAREQKAAFVAERRERAEAEGRVATDGRILGDPMKVPSGPLTMASGSSSGTSLPVPRGGRPPRTAALPAKMRQFGMRALKAPTVKRTDPTED